jgi:hypothetical protein
MTRERSEFLLLCAFALCGMVVTTLFSFADPLTLMIPN